MIEDYWQPEMDIPPETIRRLIINNNLNVMNLYKFKKWVDERYKTSQISDKPDVVNVWKDVISKFDELFK